jgi:hypothetical protein
MIGSRKNVDWLPGMEAHASGKRNHVNRSVTATPLG